jgi:ATP synthase protein I
MTTARSTTGPSTGHGSAGRQVRLPLLATVVVGAVAVIAAASSAGEPAAAGAAVGSGMVLVFFGLGAVVVTAVATVSPGASLLVALLTYTLQVVLVGLVFAVLSGSSGLDGRVDTDWVGGSIIVATLVWMVAQIVSATRSRQLLYDLPAGPSEGREASAP